jgi:hypothetical protein
MHEQLKEFSKWNSLELLACILELLADEFELLSQNSSSVPHLPIKAWYGRLPSGM